MRNAPRRVVNEEYGYSHSLVPPQVKQRVFEVLVCEVEPAQ